MLFFFFSSRRRHTRCSRDWSSDVCSSDLGAGAPPLDVHATDQQPEAEDHLREARDQQGSEDAARQARGEEVREAVGPVREAFDDQEGAEDRKSTRLNSSHGYISYAVFCLK